MVCESADAVQGVHVELNVVEAHVGIAVVLHVLCRFVEDAEEIQIRHDGFGMLQVQRLSEKFVLQIMARLGHALFELKVASCRGHAQQPARVFALFVDFHQFHGGV